MNDEIPLDDLIAHLESIGYEKRDPVEMVGEYSVRGGIVDVFSPESAKPVRIELFGDRVESIRRFEVESQRSVMKIEECTLLPLSEYQKSPGLLRELNERLEIADGESVFPGWELAAPLVRPRQGSIFGLLEKPLVVWDEPEQIRTAAERLWKRLEDPERPSLCPPEQVFFRYEELDAAAVELRELDLESAASGRLHIPTRPSLAFHGNMSVAVAEARNLVEAGGRVAFFAASTGEVERLADIFHEYGLLYQLAVDQSDPTPQYLAERAYLAGSVASVYLIRGAVERGAVFPDAGLTVFGSEDLFETSELVARPAGAKSHLATFSSDTFDLKARRLHCACRAWRGPLSRHSRDRARRSQRRLHASRICRFEQAVRAAHPHGFGAALQHGRRRGAGAGPHGRSHLDSHQDPRQSQNARHGRRAAEALRVAQNGRGILVFAGQQLAARVRRRLRVHRNERPTQRHHRHQARHGKPAAHGPPAVRRRRFRQDGSRDARGFQALGDGKQIAVLAPTTVLSFQHYETFRRRFQPFPVKIELFSRFRQAKEIKAGLVELAEGKVDIAIGTHRLLSQDVQFKDLGLVIVDEEQRFGVKHKERLKQMKNTVDVIAMSATPIPRTLHMSLLGLRDMSVIETPPKDRLSIQTLVSVSKPELIKSALELELNRGGQVYYVYNRVDSIWARAAMLQELAPQARIGVGHGQMGDAELERTMLKFMRHEYDILVCTTIVENGLDIPLANTMIIENAERYGLSELYQLRGRVGRSNRRAYAYLLVPPDKELSDTARKRLAALKEFSDLGAGFKIAALDLELRGAGNLLGGEQHGHIAAVGFDMYTRMLEETVRELKGEEVPLEIHSALNLALDIRIPTEYIADENQRLRAYRRIASARDAADRERIEKELEDRYGPPPEAVRNLLEYSSLKTIAENLGIERIDRRNGALQIKFHPETRVDATRLMNLVSRNKETQFTPAGLLRLPLDGRLGPAAVLAHVRDQLNELQG